jgi:site-specific DNA recombinase
MKIARGYCRVSTTNQDISLENQKQKIQQYCKLKGYDLIKIYEDIGGNNKQNFEILFSEISAGEIIIVSDLSRFNKRTLEILSIYEKLKELGATFACTNMDIDLSTPHGEMIITMLTAFHQRDDKNLLDSENESNT